MTYADWTPATKRRFFFILAVWFAIAYVVGSSGILVPPTPQVFQPVGLTVVIPLLIFAAAYLGIPRFRQFILTQDIRWLTGLQHWRVLGFTFLALYAFNVLPGLFAWPAGIGDVAVGLTAAIVAAHLARNAAFARTRAFVAFHVFGVLDFVVAVATATLAAGAFPTLVTAPTTDPMAMWPLNLFPSFIVPLLLMAHIAVFLQLAVQRREAKAVTGKPHAVTP